MRESRFNHWVRQRGAMYVYNGLSGSLLMVPYSHYQALKRYLAGLTKDCSPALLHDMALARMLVPDAADEVKSLSALYEQSKKDPTALGLTIVTSLGCNCDCPYCFEERRPSVMGQHVQAAILRYLDGRLPDLRSFHVAWYGGEPLIGLRPLSALSRAFISRCDTAGVAYSASIVTNGVLLDNETGRLLRELRVRTAQVTLDGPPGIHDRRRPLAGGGPTFHKIVENLGVATAYLSVTVRVNVDATNSHAVLELLTILAEQGLVGKVRVYIAQMLPYTDGPHGGDSLTPSQFLRVRSSFVRDCQRLGFAMEPLPQPTPVPCAAVRSSHFVVGSEGELYKCWNVVGHPSEALGHITAPDHLTSAASVWSEFDPFVDEECRTCSVLPICMGGCQHLGRDERLRKFRCTSARRDLRMRILTHLALTQAGNASSMTASDAEVPDTRC